MEKRVWLVLLFFWVFQETLSQDYLSYHKDCRKIEEKLLTNDLEGVIEGYLALDQSFEFIFLKDQRIALQVAYRIGDSVAFKKFANEAFSKTWSWKKAKKSLKSNPDFSEGMGKELKQISKLHPKPDFPNPTIRKQVKKLFIQDQWQALGALFTFSPERQDQYAEKKFAPKAVERVYKIQQIIEEFGFPGERLIGNQIWASTILSHYNSISEDFVRADTLYPSLKESLVSELEKGTISPFELAIIDNWYQAIRSGRTEESYGILEGGVSVESLEKVNQNRLEIGLPTVERHNELLKWQDQSKIRIFFGESWGDNSEILIKK